MIMVNVCFIDWGDISRDLFRDIQKKNFEGVALWVSEDFARRYSSILGHAVRTLEDSPDFAPSLCCYNWNVVGGQIEPLEVTFQHLYRRASALPQETWIAISAVTTAKDRLSLFLDNLVPAHKPTAWCHIACFIDYDSVAALCLNQGASAFELCEPRFHKTPYEIHGATIYQEVKTGRYWYKDTFHKSVKDGRTQYWHYEVFSKEQEHLGEADFETGILDTTKHDSSKDNKLPIN